MEPAANDVVMLYRRVYGPDAEVGLLLRACLVSQAFRAQLHASVLLFVVLHLSFKSCTASDSRQPELPEGPETRNTCRFGDVGLLRGPDNNVRFRYDAGVVGDFVFEDRLLGRAG